VTNKTITINTNEGIKKVKNLRTILHTVQGKDILFMEYTIIGKKREWINFLPKDVFDSLNPNFSLEKNK